MALVTLAQLKAKLGVSGTSQDDDLVGVIAAATAAVEAYIGYDPETTDITEDCDPNGGYVLELRDAPPKCPVTLTAVYESWGDYPPTFDSTTLLVDGTDYAQRPAGAGRLVRLNRNWPFRRVRYPDRLAGVLTPDAGTVRAAYTLDTTNALAAASRACLFECMAMVNAGVTGIGVVTSDSMDGASVSVNPNGRTGPRQDSADGFCSPIVAGLLRPFRKLPVA